MQLKTIEEIKEKIAQHKKDAKACHVRNVYERGKHQSAIEALEWALEAPQEIDPSLEGFDHLFT